MTYRAGLAREVFNKMCCAGRYVMDKDKLRAKELRQVRVGATPEEKLGF